MSDLPDPVQAPDLMPCPFCGGPAGIMRAGVGSGASIYQAGCATNAKMSGCPAWHMADTEAEAIAAWNHRSGQSADALRSQQRPRKDRT